MSLAMECSVLGCDTIGSFIGVEQALSEGWVHEDPFDECRCPEHATGDYEMKLWTEEH